MGFNFEVNGEIAELIIRDYSGAKIDSYKWRIGDKDSERGIFNTIRKKYGLFVKDNSDLDWLR